MICLFIIFFFLFLMNYQCISMKCIDKRMWIGNISSESFTKIELKELYERKSILDTFHLTMHFNGLQFFTFDVVSIFISDDWMCNSKATNCITHFKRNAFSPLLMKGENTETKKLHNTKSTEMLWQTRNKIKYLLCGIESETFKYHIWCKRENVQSECELFVHLN